MKSISIFHLLLRSLAATLLCGITACNRPIKSVEALDGCYHVSNNHVAFLVNKGQLYSKQFTSGVKIVRSFSDSSVIEFSPPVEVTVNEGKQTILHKGNSTGAIAYVKGKKVYIVMDGNGFPVTFQARPCPNQRIVY